MASEKLLIDANALPEQMVANFELCVYGGADSAECQIVLDTIAEAPTVDAVEVVRCKDCKYAMDMMPIENSGGYLMGECTLRKEDDIVFTAWGDDFCSYGERKEA